MITDLTPSAHSCQGGIFPAPRCTGTTAKGEANICSPPQVVIVISPMVKTWQDHGETKAWCRDHDRSFLERELQ